jgi:cytochrome c biogenesis protein CcdA
VTAALVMVGLLFTAAFTVARAEEATVERIKAQAAKVKQWGGYLLIAVGVWFLALALFAEFFADVFPV